MSQPTSQTGMSQDSTPGPIERFITGRGLRIACALAACYFAVEGALRLAEAKWWQAAWELAFASFFALGVVHPRHASRWWSVAFVIVMIALLVLFVVSAVRWWIRFGF